MVEIITLKVDKKMQRVVVGKLNRIWIRISKRSWDIYIYICMYDIVQQQVESVSKMEGQLICLLFFMVMCFFLLIDVCMFFFICFFT